MRSRVGQTGTHRAPRIGMTIDTPVIPGTTELGGDLARLHDVLRRIAEAQSTDPPILSLYTDLRPEAHGERPYARAELISLRHRLEGLMEAHEIHSTARTSLEADRRRFERLLDDERLAPVEGLAVFACDGIGLWETVTSAAAYGTDAVAGPIADAYPLATVVSAELPAVVALVDVHSTRLFVWRRGELAERRGPEEGPEEHRRHDAGGWSQARYQRHIDEQDRRFLRRAAGAIDRLASRERAAAIVIGADERSSSLLVPALPDRARALIVEVRHIHMHATRDEVEAEVAPLLAALGEQRGQEAADRAIAGWRAGELGAVGAEGVREMLDAGAVAELVLGPEVSRMERWTRAALVRAALLTDARVWVVRAYDALAAYDGVGATLRFRPATT
jgi:peptide chain release factor subunit 1